MEQLQRCGLPVPSAARGGGAATALYWMVALLAYQLNPSYTYLLLETEEARPQLSDLRSTGCK